MDLQQCGKAIIVVAGDLLSFVHAPNNSSVMYKIGDGSDNLYLAPIGLEPDGLLIVGSATLGVIPCKPSQIRVESE